MYITKRKLRERKKRYFNMRVELELARIKEEDRLYQLRADEIKKAEERLRIITGSVKYNDAFHRKLFE
jgi:hypothetical protein